MMAQGVRRVISIVSKQRLIGATNGSSAYLVAIARSLAAAGFSVELLQPSPAIAGRTPIMAIRREMAVFDRHLVRGALRLGNVFFFAKPSIWAHAVAGILARIARKAGVSASWAADRPAPYAVATQWLEDDHVFLRRNLNKNAVAVIADYMFCAPAFADLPDDVPKAIIMHDLFHSRDGKGKDSVALMRRDEEILALSAADVVFAIQQTEQSFVASQVPGIAAMLVPMPAVPVPFVQPGYDDSILFIGSNTAPNSDGLRAFLQTAWPRILEKRPHCRLEVAGTVNRAFAGETYRNTQFHGMVDDLDGLYRTAGIIISPLTFGSGLKIKLIDGLAQGKAMVVSSITLQGVEDICGPAVLLADSDDDVVSRILSLVQDCNARQALGARALGCARDNFTADIVHHHLREWALRL